MNLAEHFLIPLTIIARWFARQYANFKGNKRGC